MKTHRNSLLGKYHVLVKYMSADERLALLSGWGVESAKDLSVRSLGEIICKLEGVGAKVQTYEGAKVQTNDAGDVWRKRCMGAIGSWAKKRGYSSGIEYIKSIMMRCGGEGCKTVNDIPVSKLRGIYSEFCKLNSVQYEVEHLVKEITENQIQYN